MALPDFLACRPCGLLSAPIVDGGEVELLSDPDRLWSDPEIFRDEHAPHGIELAVRCDTPAVYDGPIWDPMVIAWFEVRIGRDTFLVRSWRPSVDEPRRQELHVGVIERGLPTIEIDEPYLVLALDRWFFPHVLGPNRCAHLLRTLNDLIGRLHPDELDTQFDDADDAEIGVAPFPDSLLGNLAERTRKLFDPVEQDRLIRFLHAHRREDGALALRVRRPFLVRAA